MPVKRENGWRIRVFVKDGELAGRSLSLGWYDLDPPIAGETWQLRVKLSRPRGMVNPGLFDYEAWLLSQTIHGTGYVLSGASTSRIKEHRVAAFFERTRQQLANEVTGSVAATPARAMLLALLIGDSSQLSGDVWRTLSATGTNHLLIVSGLHVSLVIGLIYWSLLRVFRWPRGFAAFGAIALAMVYSLLTGFGLPVQRALIMSAVGLLVVSARRQIAIWHGLTLAMVCILLINPFASMTAGFWLSFAAVGGLLFAFQGRGWSKQFLSLAILRSQWVALLATAPFLLCWVFKFSFASVAANLIAIPVVSIFVVPALLLFLLTKILHWTAAADGIVDAVLACLTYLYQFLQYLADLQWLVYQPVAIGLPLLLAMIGSLLLLLPNIALPRWTGVLCWLPVFFPVVDGVKGTYVRLYDVGQGLSLLIRHGPHNFIYDTGPAMGRFDAGEQILVPALHQAGINQIDLLVISHGDNDHAGGAPALARSVPILESVSGPCFEPRFWQFGDAKLWLLQSQGSKASFTRNDLSCVLLIETPETKILLPGDIESRAEQELISLGLPAADLLVAPHHGSISSSTPAFINAVDPDWVLFSTGYLNRFDHPHPEVMNRYRNRGIRSFNTAASGAINIHFMPAGQVEIGEARRTARRFWYDAASRPELR
jgi:competence protein ComEC